MRVMEDHDHGHEPITVLLIEDSDMFCRFLCAMIGCSPVPATVTTACRLAQGLESLQKQNIQLVLLDLSLPDSVGLETLAAVRDQSPEVPVVVITGVDDEQSALEALKLGAQDYLLKGDINTRQLHRTINYAIERKRLHLLEEERVKLYQLREDFMAALTHDLKNPLIGTNRILDLIASEQLGPLPGEVSDLLRMIHKSNDALLAMIRNMVEVYRYEKNIDSLLPENTDLGKVIGRYLDAVKPIIQDRGITVHLDMPESVEPVFADETAMLRVVQNLLENAIKFSRGRIDVKLWSAEQNALFAVSDNGPGISEEDKKRLFQRFWQGQPGRQHAPGTGLGLYLCRQIIEAHKGQIWCQSTESQGATFTVSLPTIC